MTLGGKVVYLIGLNLLNDPDEVCGIRQVSVVEMQSTIMIVGILVEVVDAIGIEKGCPAFDAVDLVSLL
ncbi:hypothetical protein D3C72_891390 [compost metagenome]